MRLRAVLAVLTLGLATACGSDSDSGDSGPVTLTLWTRAATEVVSKACADAYNKTHDNKVEVTAFPNEEYPAKLASSARSLQQGS
jgi:multiple sugar transport system substrate-binding protein